MELSLLIAAVIVLIPLVAIWVDDQRDRMHPKSS